MRHHGAPKRKKGCFIEDCSGDAVVEATILFPVMILIFAALVMLAIYLPVQATLQRATQYAATAIATEISDSWLYFDDAPMSYQWHTHKSQLPNVYSKLFSGSYDADSRAEEIVTHIENQGISLKSGELLVRCKVSNYILHREVIVTATREMPIAVNLSFIGFPESISITATSGVFVNDGDEFIRNIDLASDFVEFIAEKFELDDAKEAISNFGDRVRSILGWND